MMVAVDLETYVTDDLAVKRVFTGSHKMTCTGVEHGRSVLRRDILIQRTAHKRAERLYSAAYPEERHFTEKPGIYKEFFGKVASFDYLAAFRQDFFVIFTRVDIGTARKKYSVKT